MDDVDDTDMSPEEFLAAFEKGQPVTLLKSREEYEAAIAANPTFFDSPDSFTMLYADNANEGPMSTPLSVPWRDLDGMKAEKFISVMLLREYPDGARRRPTQGDGGIDVIVPVSDNPRRWDVYQIKSFSDGSLTSSQRGKVKESVERLFQNIEQNNLSVAAWHLVVPVDPSQKDHEWLEGLFRGSGVQGYWKGQSYLEGLVAKYRDVYDFYLRDGQERLHSLVESALQMAGMQLGKAVTGVDEKSLYNSLSTTLDRLSTDDPHYSYGLAVGYDHDEINRAPSSVAMSHVMGYPGGPAMRVDVYPKYRLALEDRPITANLKLNVPDSESELQNAIDRFNVYGDDLTVPPQFASVSISDPVAGDSSIDKVEVRLTSHDNGPSVRVRYIVAEKETGTRLASAFFDVLERRSGASGEGHLFRLRSESGLISVEQWARATGNQTYNGQFNFKIDWNSRIAARIANDLRFANAVRSGRKLVLAQEFTGPYEDIAHFDEIERPPVPDWLVRYVDALTDLQEYADVPLETLSGEEEDPDSVVQNAVSVASLLHGGKLGQRSPKMGVMPVGVDPEELVEHVNENGRLAIVTPFLARVANGHVNIPGVTYRAENVTASLAEVAGERQVILSSPDGEVTMTAALEREDE